MVRRRVKLRADPVVWMGQGDRDCGCACGGGRAGNGRRPLARLLVAGGNQRQAFLRSASGVSAEVGKGAARACVHALAG